MATLKVPTSFNIDVEFEIPEFFRRLLSLFIDMIIQLLYLILAMRLLDLIVRNMDFSSGNAGYDTSALTLLFMVPVFTYHVVQESLMNGQSFGKKIMRLRVVNENGGRAGIGQFMIRWLLRISDTWIVLLLFIIIQSQYSGYSTESTFIIAAAVIFLLADIILVISSPKGQRIGDFLAKTILIRTHTRASITETVFQEVEESYTPVFPAIMRLSDKDINAIKSILESARRRSDPGTADSAAFKIKNHLGIETDMDSVMFLATLLKDYNYLSVKN